MAYSGTGDETHSLQHLVVPTSQGALGHKWKSGVRPGQPPGPTLRPVSRQTERGVPGCDPQPKHA